MANDSHLVGNFNVELISALDLKYIVQEAEKLLDIWSHEALLPKYGTIVENVEVMTDPDGIVSITRIGPPTACVTSRL